MRIAPPKIDFTDLEGNLIGGVEGSVQCSSFRMGVDQFTINRAFFNCEDPRGLKLILKMSTDLGVKKWKTKIMRQPLSCSPAVTLDGKTWLFEIVGMIGKEMI